MALDQLTGGIHFDTLGDKHTKGPISLLDVTKPEDYADIKSEYDKLKSEDKLDELFPIINQDDMIIQVLSYLSGEFPYSVMIGQPGVGKSLTLDFVVDVLTEEIDMEKVEKWIPESVPLFESVKAKLSTFQHRDYLSLPNLLDPTNVKPLSYSDFQELEKDKELVDSFFGGIREYLNSFSLNRRGSLRRVVDDEKSYRSFARNEVHDMMVEVMGRFGKQIRKDAGTTKNDDLIGILGGKIDKTKARRSGLERALSLSLELSKGLKDNRRTAFAKIGKLENFGGIGSGRTGISREHVEEGIRDTFFVRELNEGLARVSNVIGNVTISEKEDFDGEKRQEILVEEFNKYMKDFEAFYRKENGNPDRTFTSTFGDLSTSLRPPVLVRPRISLDVINEISDTLTQRSKNYKDKGSEQLGEYIDSTIKYFKTNARDLEGSLEDFLIEVEEIEKEHALAVRNAKSKIAPAAVVIKSEDGVGAKGPLTGDEEQFIDAIDSVEFKLPHGSSKIGLEDLLTSVILTNPGASKDGVSPVKIINFNKDTICSIKEDGSGPTDEPYHTRVSELGPFFEGGILLFKDDFRSFVQYVVKGEDKTKTTNHMELILEFLESGDMTVMVDNVHYTFKAPRMILGAGNEYPFLLIEDSGEIRHLDGLESRISLVHVRDSVKDSEEARLGSMRVIMGAVENYNKENGTTLELDQEIINFMLESSRNAPGVLSLEYRRMEKGIDNICAYARTKGISTINMNFFREMGMRFLHPMFHMFVDKDNPVKMFKEPMFKLDPKTGELVQYSTEIFDHYGVRAPVLTTLELGSRSDERESRFMNVDRNLTDVKTGEQHYMTQKAHLLAATMVQNLLYSSEQTRELLSNDRDDWRLKTQFEEEWQVGDGPSASAATAVSMLSALSGRSIRTNRFMTGTIGPDGKVGAIGGAYTKASVAHRYRELYRENGADREMYFIFPTSNLIQMRKAMEVDMLMMQDSIPMIPVSTFEQADYLSTSGETISKSDMKNAQEKGAELIQEDLGKIKNRIEKKAA